MTRCLIVLLLLPLSGLCEETFLLDGRSPGSSGHDTACVRVESLRPYRLDFEARKLPGVKGRTLCAGLPGSHVDLEVTETRTPYSVVVAAPTLDSGFADWPCRFGLWGVDGVVEVSGFRVAALDPVHASRDGLTLGVGEWALGNRYVFQGAPGSAWRNFSRVVHSRNESVAFNTDRYPIRDGGEIVYLHELGSREIKSACITVEARYFTSGPLEVSVSRDGRAWRRLGEVEARQAADVREVPSFRGEVPAEMLPAGRLYVRLRGGHGVRAQLTDYVFEAMYSGSPVYLRGATSFDGSPPVAEVPVGYTSQEEAVLSSSDAVVLWSAPSECKVPPVRSLPGRKASSLSVELAGGESEAVQLVLTAVEPMNDVSVEVELPGLDADVRRVGYVNVTHPVDGSAPRGLYPDPLLPVGSIRRLCEGRNCPFWIRVKAPKAARRGTYSGIVRVEGRRANGSLLSLFTPLTVRVFGFALPDVSTCKTMFGLYPEMINRYHAVKTEADRRKVYESYYRVMRDCRLSESSGCTLADPSWLPSWIDDEPVFRWEQWDRAVTRAFDEFHFNAVRLSNGLGIGTGDAQSQKRAEIDGVVEGDPRYELRLSRLLGGLERHLEERGWLDRVYVYCYDEPQGDAARQVAAGFAKLERYAPKIRRLLTSPCLPVLAGAPHVWCPYASQFGGDEMKRRKAAGDEFWMYVCTNPRAPYAGEFIEHPGTSLRTWLWQCRAEGVTGVLLWCVNYWNSPSRYPLVDRPQNPYSDPHAWDPVGWNWGGGEGRLFYPPRSVFVSGGGNPATLTDKPNFDEPVSSIRAEMLRDGIEDFEYFAILERLDPGNALLAVPPSVTKSLSEYDPDSFSLKVHRRLLAVAIEGLLTKKGL